jgi:hypothetical protein
LRVIIISAADIMDAEPIVSLCFLFVSPKEFLSTLVNVPEPGLCAHVVGRMNGVSKEESRGSLLDMTRRDQTEHSGRVMSPHQSCLKVLANVIHVCTQQPCVCIFSTFMYTRVLDIRYRYPSTPFFFEAPLVTP